MKKLDEKERARLLRLRNKREKYRITKKKRRRDIALERGDFAFQKICVPTICCLNKDADAFLNCVSELQLRALKSWERVFLDFSSTEFMSEEAALILAAEVERCRSLRYRGGRPTVTGNYPLSDDIRTILTDLGFFEHLKLMPPKIRTAPDNRKIIRIKSGIRVKSNLIDELYELVFSRNTNLSRRNKSNLFRGLSEAMTNVASHAYVDLPHHSTELPFLRGRWWMSCYRDDASHTLGAYLYDQGVGIPSTVPYRHGSLLRQLALRLGLGTADGDMIKAAMALGTTATGQTHRGKGMLDLRRLIDHTCGELRITSGRGRYVLANDGGTTQERVEEMGERLRGTMVAWTFQAV